MIEGGRCCAMLQWRPALVAPRGCGSAVVITDMVITDPRGCGSAWLRVPVNQRAQKKLKRELMGFKQRELMSLNQARQRELAATA